MAAVGFFYSPCLQNSFVNWDDDSHIYENSTIKTLNVRHIKEIFSDFPNLTFIPLTILSFAVEHHFFGHNSFVYHLNNLVLHLCVVGLVFLFLRMLGASFVASLVAMIFFGIHPMHVESVAWITERKDVLYAFFYMLSLCAYVRYISGKRMKWYVISVVMGLASMLAKPMALSLPLILFLLDWFLQRKISLKLFLEKIPYILYIIPIGWLTYSLNARVPMQNIFEAPLIWIWTFVFYLQKFVFPVLLVPLYTLPQPVTPGNFAYLASLILFSLIVLAVVCFRKNRNFVFAVLFYFLSIFFLLRFDTAADVTPVADRFMYLPSIGFSFLIGVFFENVIARRKTFLVAFSLLILVLSAKTFLQCRVWKDSATLWKHQITYAPHTAVGLNNLGVSYIDFFYATGELRENSALQREIESLYFKALAIDPFYRDACFNLAQTYLDIGDDQKALHFFLRAKSIDPNDTDVLSSLGQLYSKMGKTHEAFLAFREIVDISAKQLREEIKKATNNVSLKRKVRRK